MTWFAIVVQEIEWPHTSLAPYMEANRRVAVSISRSANCAELNENQGHFAEPERDFPNANQGHSIRSQKYSPWISHTTWVIDVEIADKAFAGFHAIPTDHIFIGKHCFKSVYSVTAPRSWIMSIFCRFASKVVSMLVEPVRPTIQVTEKAENPGLISAKVCPRCPIKSACGLRNLLTMSGSYKVADALRKI